VNFTSSGTQSLLQLDRGGRLYLAMAPGSRERDFLLAVAPDMD